MGEGYYVNLRAKCTSNLRAKCTTFGMSNITKVEVQQSILALKGRG